MLRWLRGRGAVGSQLLASDIMDLDSQVMAEPVRRKGLV